jgi:hypothetical protein
MTASSRLLSLVTNNRMSLVSLKQTQPTKKKPAELAAEIFATQPQIANSRIFK